MSDGFVREHYPFKTAAPAGWSVTAIEQVASEVTSGFPSGLHNSEGKGMPHVRPMNIDREGRFDLSEVKYVDGKVPRMLRNGDVLFNNTNSPELIGKTTDIALEMPLAYSNHMTRIRLRRGMNPRFVARQLHYLWMSGYFRHRCKNHVNQASIASDPLSKTVPLLVAPESEQTRIADVLDELLSDVDAGVKSLEGVWAKLRQYRAAVLNAAVEGTFTRESKFHSVPLSHLITGLGQGWSPRCELTRAPLDNEWAIIKTTAVQSMRFLENEAKPLPDGLFARPHLEIKPGDMLMTRKGPRQRAGVACYVRATRPRLMICDTVYRFTCRSDLVEPRYLELVLNSPRVIAEIDKKKSGINDSGVSLTHTKLGELAIRLPSLQAQAAIVEVVEDQLSVIGHLESSLEVRLESAKALRQSILKAAFEGKLVPQDPNDEPASELLTRIATERAEQQLLAKKAPKPERPAGRSAGNRKSAVSAG